MSKRYKCLIADDEKRIADLIKLLGHWDEYDIEIVDTCYNGNDALDSIINLKPDLVITDIKMPGNDGLKLIEKCKTASVDCVFIIVSGYKHFEYAKSAIQFGVADYILKPIEEIQLNKAIFKSIKMISEKEINIAIKSERDEYLGKYNEMKYNDFWRQLFLTTLNEVDFDYHIYAEILKNKFVHQTYKLIFIRTSIDDLLANNSLFSEKLASILKNIESDNISILYQQGLDGIFILINYQDLYEKFITQTISNIFYSIRRLTEIYDEFDVSFGYSSSTDNLNDLNRLMMEAIAAETSKLLYGLNRIISFSTLKNLKRIEEKNILTTAQMKNLENAYEYLQEGKIKKIYLDIINNCTQYINYNPWDMIIIQRKIISKIMSLFIRDNEQLEDMIINILRKTHNSNDFVILMEKTFNYIEEYFESFLNGQRQKHILPTEKAIKYIEANYAKPISLEEVAEYVDLSPTYFSKIFKRELGKGYAEFLAEYRINQSKRMLSNTKNSVKSIAISVGYPDPKYYSKLFKKMTGIKPSEYRKLYM